ncbi:MAG TPA: hypothetical protein VF139_16410 [Candidatus Polarisedimenticolaceae bacterium]
MTFVRNLQDEESREFWSNVDAGAREVDGWPEWKRRMIVGELEDERPSPERAESDPRPCAD